MQLPVIICIKSEDFMPTMSEALAEDIVGIKYEDFIQIITGSSIHYPELHGSILYNTEINSDYSY